MNHDQSQAAGRLGGAENRRRSDRVIARGPLMVQPVTGAVDGQPGIPIRVLLLDRSATGLGVLYGRPLTAGQRFLVPPSLHTYTVVRSEQAADGVYFAGLEMCPAASAAMSAGAA